MINTLMYYNENADHFIEGTMNVDMSPIQNKFISYLKEGSHILDAGCGSGRDSLAFKKRGYKVTAIDGSEVLCEKASKLLGEPVRQMMFQEIEDENIYEGIWACATLLHVPQHQILDVFRRLTRALKQDGVLYVSFKYGTFEGERNGRWFNDYTEEKFEELIRLCPELTVLETWITIDVRPDRQEKWLNIIMKKDKEV